MHLGSKQNKAYLLLVGLIICGLATATVTANKVVHLGVNFPFSNIVFSIFTYPMIDCVCELWGKKIARQTIWLALGSQVLIMLLMQLSVAMPGAAYWHQQAAYSQIFASSERVVVASLLAFLISQVLDVTVYQKVKELSQGRFLWLRTNISTFIGQLIDSSLFIGIVYYGSSQKLNILLGSITIKIIISILMTPIVYLITLSIDKYLDSNTGAFKLPSQNEGEEFKPPQVEVP